MKQYNLYEEQIKILMKDAFLKGVEISYLRQNEFTNSSTMDNFEKINSNHIAEAIQYRSFDRKLM